MHPPLITLHNLDCLPAMREMVDNQFDLAIVDPPYRDSNQPTQDMKRSGSMKSLSGRPEPEYFEQLFRVAKECIIWGANNFQLPQWKGFVVWRKILIPEKFTMSMCEIASISEGLGTIAKHVEISPKGQFRIHPTQKPVALYKWLLRNYATEGDTILDTHLGSGSIAIACHDYGFNLTGFELDPDYYAAAVKRLDDHRSQMELGL